MAFPFENPPIGLHLGMFRTTLTNQMTEVQKATWLTRADNFDMIGTYAQTELGHGKPRMFKLK